jgi:multiple antibiotic resistance protein
MLEFFIKSFIPLFIVVDALGNLPFVMGLTASMTDKERRKVMNLAVFTATLVGLLFLFFGQFILNVMNIEVYQFAIAGGIILLVLSIKYMITGHMVEVKAEEMVAIVPIGTPLTVGPATITTLLLLASQPLVNNQVIPLWIVLVSFAANMLITWFFFRIGGFVVKFLGHGGLTATSRVFDLLLGAIAVSMIINGLITGGIIKVAG